MAPAADPATSPSISTANSDLQPFFVLHKAATRKPASKTRRRIDLSPKVSDGSAEEYNDNSRFETFKLLWSNTESIIKDVLKNLNTSVFDEINKWVHASFDSICACRTREFSRATSMYPIPNNVPIGAQIFTALLFTKNVEFVDDISTFADLGAHLRSNGCLVANLTSIDFCAKNGVGGCLKTLLRQFLLVGIDAPEMSILASWYTEQENHDKPLIVIIDDVERCSSSVLNDFIVMLREWVVKVPIILVLGVATSVDALRNILCSSASLYLSVREFYLGTPTEKMDAVIEAVLLRSCQSFNIGKHVSTFLRNYFLRHDGTLTLFVKALRIATAQQVFSEPLSFVLRKLIDEEGTEGLDGDNNLLSEPDIKRALQLPSLQRFCETRGNCIDWVYALSELKRLHQLWSSLVMCLYEVGRCRKISLLDLFCEMLKLKQQNFGVTDLNLVEKDYTTSVHNHHSLGCLQDKGYIVRAFQMLRDLPAMELCKILDRWEMLTRGIAEIHEKVKELQSRMTLEENQSRRDLREESKRPTSRTYKSDRTSKSPINEKVASFLQSMFREHIQTIESIPLHEIIFFDNVDNLHTALIGDPRRRIQADLLESRKFLKCSCCRKNDGVLVPSMHDTSIMYTLAEEHGDLINVHEWFHSFMAVISNPPLKAKKRSRMSPSPKKRKVSKEAQTKTDASIQAEFCRAVTELQITGLLRMPTKRRPDYVQRVAFGL
ncbi:origin of replication complex subunit 3 isoform X2 [Salvia miltiorrhiza]|uniref:origin of replication complex subunit 3 isoform X2 n=1 Tax=Salvia miltiorrhiza TaxID=226208 RepID=UPI0025ABE19A|nr:origin of replication complex subunit 3 isoform X2 [Salvia miltiorrhiza]XP_057779123.1 origin of replication complex subunit 3 isoform X2 [Salvia miltiorrhiza]